MPVIDLSLSDDDQQGPVTHPFPPPAASCRPAQAEICLLSSDDDEAPGVRTIQPMHVSGPSNNALCKVLAKSAAAKAVSPGALAGAATGIIRPAQSAAAATEKFTSSQASAGGHKTCETLIKQEAPAVGKKRSAADSTLPAGSAENLMNKRRAVSALVANPVDSCSDDELDWLSQMCLPPKRADKQTPFQPNKTRRLPETTTAGNREPQGARVVAAKLGTTAQLQGASTAAPAPVVSSKFAQLPYAAGVQSQHSVPHLMSRPHAAVVDDTSLYERGTSGAGVLGAGLHCSSSPAGDCNKVSGMFDQEEESTGPSSSHQVVGRTTSGAGLSQLEVKEGSGKQAEGGAKRKRLTEADKQERQRLKEEAKRLRQEQAQQAKVDKARRKEEEKQAKVATKQANLAAAGNQVERFLICQASCSAASLVNLCKELSDALQRRKITYEVGGQQPLSDKYKLRSFRWLQRVPKQAAATFGSATVFSREEGVNCDDGQYVAFYYPDVCLVMTAEEFVKEVERDHLETLIARARSEHAHCSLTILAYEPQTTGGVVGLRSYLQKRLQREQGFNDEHVWEKVMFIQLSEPAVRLRYDLDEQGVAAHLDQRTWALSQQIKKQKDGVLTCFGNGKNTAPTKKAEAMLADHGEPVQACWRALCHLTDPMKAAAIAMKFRSLGAVVKAVFSGDVRAQFAGLRTSTGMAVGPRTIDKVVSYFQELNPNKAFSACGKDDH